VQETLIAGLDDAVQIPAAAVLRDEGNEGGEEHGGSGF